MRSLVQSTIAAAGFGEDVMQGVMDDDRSRFVPALSNADQAQQHLVAREMQHRLRNTLAVLQAIIRQSLRSASSKEQAEEIIGERILALSKANDMLIEHSIEHLRLRELVARMLSLHDSSSPSRFRIDGPDVFLDQRTSLGLALILHEMATNAVKYGALSNEKGHVDLLWQVSDDGAGPALNLNWIERDGPIVSAPQRIGFGTRLIESALRDVGAITQLSLPQSGAELKIHVALPEAEAMP
jgi:two-component sensor histidine kinase